jgi:hypothetical protein
LSAQPPPDDLMQWSKPALVRELHRLRAMTREHAEHVRSDSAEHAGAVIGGSPHGRGDALLDTRGAVLLDYTEVVLVDREPDRPDRPPAAMLVLAGRVNFDTRRSQTAYLTGTDGAAAIVSELTALAERAGGDYAASFKADLERRLKEMP